MVYIVHGKLSRIYSSGWSCSNHLIWEWQSLLNLNNSQFIMSVVNHNKFFFVIELLSGTILDQGVRQGCLKDGVTFTFSKHITQLFRWTVSLLKIWVKEFHVQTDITLCCSNEQLNLLVAHEDNNISGNYEQFCKQLIQHVFHTVVYFYTTWQIPFVSFSCRDSYSPRGPKQHWMIGSIQTALGRTAPYISA